MNSVLLGDLSDDNPLVQLVFGSDSAVFRRSSFILGVRDTCFMSALVNVSFLFGRATGSTTAATTNAGKKATSTTTTTSASAAAYARSWLSAFGCLWAGHYFVSSFSNTMQKRAFVVKDKVSSTRAAAALQRGGETTADAATMENTARQAVLLTMNELPPYARRHSLLFETLHAAALAPFSAVAVGLFSSCALGKAKSYEGILSLARNRGILIPTLLVVMGVRLAPEYAHALVVSSSSSSSSKDSISGGILESGVRHVAVPVMSSIAMRLVSGRWETSSSAGDAGNPPQRRRMLLTRVLERFPRAIAAIKKVAATTVALPAMIALAAIYLSAVQFFLSSVLSPLLFHMEVSRLSSSGSSTASHHQRKSAGKLLVAASTMMPESAHLFAVPPRQMLESIFAFSNAARAEAEKKQLLDVCRTELKQCETALLPFTLYDNLVKNSRGSHSSSLCPLLKQHVAGDDIKARQAALEALRWELEHREDNALATGSNNIDDDEQQLLRLHYQIRKVAPSLLAKTSMTQEEHTLLLTVGMMQQQQQQQQETHRPR